MQTPAHGSHGWLRSLALLALICACDRGGSSGHDPEVPAPSEGSMRHIDEVETRARPSGEPADRYGVEHSHSLSPIEQAIIDQVDDGYRGDLTHDAALSAMIRDLAVTTPTRFDMPPTLIDALMAWHGIADPQPAVIVVEVAGSEHGCDRELAPECEEAVAALADEVVRTLAKQGRWRVGVGVMAVEGGARTRMMVGVVERTVVLAPMAIEVGASGKVDLRGKLLGRRKAPRIERVDPSGKWTRVPAVVGDDGSIRTDLHCDAGRGAYQVEILADGETGPEVVANFRIFCGVQREREIEFSYERIGPKVTVADVVRGNFDLLNEEREARGLPALAWDERAAAVAKAHSEDMLASGFIGHVSPTTGDASTRFRKAGIEGIVVRENVARGYGPKGIHESLMNSPGHRANLLADDVTHVGIGVVFGEPESTAANAPRPVFLTQNFYSKPGGDAPTNPSATLRAKIDQTREDLSLPALGWHKGLGKLAQQRAEAITGAGPAMDDDEYRAKLTELGLKSLEQHQVTGGSFASLVELELWQQLEAGGKLGIGVAQVDEGAGGGFVLIILVGK
ncbi:CAP domain-containing protein [Nannocystaceae bacterium ST9]